MTRLEELACQIIEPGESHAEAAARLRAHLRSEIARRHSQRAGSEKVPLYPVEVTCSICTDVFLVSEGRARAMRRTDFAPVCRDCRSRADLTPGPREQRWAAARPDAVAAMAALLA